MAHSSILSWRLDRLMQRLPIAAVLSRFALVGVVVAAIHFTLVSILALAGVPIQIALAVGYVVSLTIHFTLNRQWVFAAESGYAFHISGQGVRYLVAAGFSYAGAAVGVALLPGALGIPDLAAFFISTCAMAGVSFLALHLWIFRAAPPATSDEAA